MSLLQVEVEGTCWTVCFAGAPWGLSVRGPMLCFGLWVEMEVTGCEGTVLVSGHRNADSFKKSKWSPVSLLVSQAGTVSALSLINAADAIRYHTMQWGLGFHYVAKADAIAETSSPEWQDGALGQTIFLEAKRSPWTPSCVKRSSFSI